MIPAISRDTLRDMLATTAEQWAREGDVHALSEEAPFASTRHRWPWDVILYAQKLAWMLGEDAALARLNGATFEQAREKAAA